MKNNILTMDTIDAEFTATEINLIFYAVDGFGGDAVPEMNSTTFGGFGVAYVLAAIGVAYKTLPMSMRPTAHATCVKIRNAI